MLQKLVTTAFKRGPVIQRIYGRWFRMSCELGNLHSSQEPEDVIPRKETISYIFKDVKNESIIKEFCLGELNPQVLKMPDLDTSDEPLLELLTKLATLDLANYEKGLEQLKELGVFGALIPRNYGGLGYTATQCAYLLQNDKLADWSVSLIAHQNMCAQTILQYGSEQQKSYYLPKLASGEFIGAFCLTEKSSGSDIFSMETEAVLTALEDSYVLRGTKNWVVNGHVADVFVVFTRTQDSKYEGGRDFITALIVDRTAPGVSVGEAYSLDWLPNSQVSDVHFNDVFVPIDKVLAEANGGYKIANQIQNNARYTVAVCMSGIMRSLVDELGDKESRGHIVSGNTLVDHLLDECVARLFAVESSLYFTTRFADKYVSPEIELESAAVKVFSAESATVVGDHYCTILGCIGEHISLDRRKLLNRVQGLQMFLGSNQFTRLYIGGTLLEISSNYMVELKQKARNPVANYPWMREIIKTSSRSPIKWSGGSITAPDNNQVLQYNLFLKELEVIFRKLQMMRFRLVGTFKRYRHTTLEYQYIMLAMSDIGVMVYALLGCVARANTNFGDFEVRCTRNMLEKCNDAVDETLRLLRYSYMESGQTFVSNLAQDVKLAGGYPSLDVLEMRRELSEKEHINIYDEHRIPT